MTEPLKIADRLEAWTTYTTTTVELHRDELDDDLRAAVAELRAQQQQLDSWARVMPLSMRLAAARLEAYGAAKEES